MIPGASFIAARPYIKWIFFWFHDDLVKLWSELEKMWHYMSLTNSHSQLLSHGEVFMFIIWLLDQPLDHDELCFTLSRENNGSTKPPNGNGKTNGNLPTNKKTGISQKLFYKRSLIIDCLTNTLLETQI